MEIQGAAVDAARLVRDARYAAGQTQMALADRAGVSRATVAAIETGARSPSWAMLSKILAATGKQMRVELEPLDEDLRRAVAAMGESAAGSTEAADDLSMTVSLMEGLVDVGYRFEGTAAAALLGGPIPLPGRVGLALPDGPEAVGWLVRLMQTGAAAVTPLGRSYPLDGVRSPEGVARLVELGDGGAFLLNYWLRTFLVRFAPHEETARAVLVVGEHAPLRVQPLHEIEATDKHVARVLRLLREQAQDPRGG
ncbi:helix-turn-helix transcriptional regulator [Promicromonospora sp. NPDC050880]|uniref:helix-turn-helix transcriptional regulator n=1 Tax=Promicromonospora sp. NPDC050880 TaxID=3364406 RepID=UPI003787E7C0